MAFFSNEYLYAALHDAINNLAAYEHLQLPDDDLEQCIVFFIFDGNINGNILNKRYLTYNIKKDLTNKVRENIHAAILQVSLKYRLDLITKPGKPTGLKGSK